MATADLQCKRARAETAAGKDLLLLGKATTLKTNWTLKEGP